MNRNDADYAAMNTTGTFILGTSLAGWIAGMALVISILMLAAAPTAITQLFSVGTVLVTLILSAWLARRLKNNR